MCSVLLAIRESEFTIAPQFQQHPMIIMSVKDVNGSAINEVENAVFLVAVERAKSRPMSAGEL